MIPIRDTTPTLHRPWGVYALILLNTLAFLWELTLSPAGQQAAVQALGVIPTRELAGQGGWAEVTVPLFSYMFLHASWPHFLMNMWALWIFADNVEDVMGTGRFVLFYLLCGLTAIGGHVLLNQAATQPIIGASGAIAGTMGAYLLLFPRGRVVTLIPVLFIPYFVELPSVLFLSIWFLVQLFSGLVAAGNPGQGGIAFTAHVVGFLTGIGLVPLFRRSA